MKRVVISQKQLVGFTAIFVVVLLGFLMYLPRQPSSSPLTGHATSQIGNLSAGVATYLSCVWSDAALSVSFGSNLNPGTLDINATGNYNVTYPGNGTMYNITVDTISNVAANITIKGENFVSGSNVIGVTNITWASNTTAMNGSNFAGSNGIVLNTSFNDNTKLAIAEPVGSTVWFRFWLDVPNATTAGSYTGNYTQQCSQAI